MRPVLTLMLLVIISLVMTGCPGKPADLPDTSESVSTVSTEYVPPADPTQGLEKGDPGIGQEFFLDSNRGKCLDCHTLAGEGNNRDFEGQLWALDDTGLRRNPEWLAIFLDNPRNLRPEVARMPPFRGDNKGATIADVVAYLMTLTQQVEHPESTDLKPAGEPDPNFEGIGGYTGHHGGY